MNFPLLKQKSTIKASVPSGSVNLEEHHDESRTAQRRADKWMIAGAALMGMCHFLDNTRDKWSGTFIALFQPGEEIGAGAEAMVDDGLVDRIPFPEVCFGQHVMPGRAGQVMSKSGPQFAACDSIRIRIPGRSAHGSMPHNAIDPTYTAAMIIARLQG